MGKHDKTKRREYLKRRKQVKKLKTKTRNDKEKELETCNINVTTLCAESIDPKDVNLGCKRENKVSLPKPGTESSIGNYNSTFSSSSCSSPFKVSLSDNESCKYASSVKSNQSFSWERTEATDPLIVR